ncbi:MAG: helix-hairpin-helix domain-containing protein [Oligoflexia bacterium]|nr:helix-hairpin-helix domain-containing protein [Oligoflexia bacterium]
MVSTTSSSNTSSHFDINAINYCQKNTNITKWQIENLLKLLVTESCSVPFVARYRKEVTGNLDEVQIRDIEKYYQEYLETESRRSFILETLKKLEVLTPELEKLVSRAQNIKELEDLYAPYKSKKKTKAMLAKELGLLPLAQEMMTTLKTIEQLSSEFIPTEKVTSFEQALEGATHIIIETFAHNLKVKESLRKEYWENGILASKLRDEGKEIEDYLKFKDFFDFQESVKSLKDAKNTHRYLAIRRGFTLKVLKMEVEFDKDQALTIIKEEFFADEKKHGVIKILKQAAEKAYSLHIHPSLDLEIKTDLKEIADEAAINVFSINLKNLLLAPYLGAKSVMGVDPGVRTGCKIVVVDDTGKFVVDFVIYPHPPLRDIQNSKVMIEKTIEHFKIHHVAIGNGTYGRETLQFFEDEVSQVKEKQVLATMISEAGASIYSASDIAREEFPDKDPTVRGAISIARRFQDPLAELVKIDAKSIGVGQYQHDVNQNKLKKSLENVVESCVNFVGVDLNTASAPLLSYISGVGPKLAQAIVKYRQQKGGLKNRQELLEVPRFSNKVFTEAAGFLRIYNGENPFDQTSIHPEQYPVLEEWSKGAKLNLREIVLNKETDKISLLAKDKSLSEKIGTFTFSDIIKSLSAPSQDPRTTFKSVEFSQKLREFSDLSIGEWYTGVVTNIAKFGAFVDIGIKENGLLHISEVSDKYVSDVLEEIKVGQEVKVRVISIDKERKRISLSRKSDTPLSYSPTSPTSLASKSNTATQHKNKSKDNQQHQAHQQQQVHNNAFSKLKNWKSS